MLRLSMEAFAQGEKAEEFLLGSEDSVSEDETSWSSLTNLCIPKLILACFSLMVCCSNPAHGLPGYLEQRLRNGNTPGAAIIRLFCTSWSIPLALEATAAAAADDAAAAATAATKGNDYQYNDICVCVSAQAPKGVPCYVMNNRP